MRVSEKRREDGEGNLVGDCEKNRNSCVFDFMQCAGCQRKKAFSKDACFDRYSVSGIVVFV